MAYEREAISETVTPQKIEMREERVVEPYLKRPTSAPKAAVEPAKVGQPNNSVSASPEESQGAPAESVTLAPAAAALARKEQRFRQAEQALKDREKALEVERAEIADLRAMKAKLAKKDFSDFEKAVPYDEYTNYWIEKNAGSDPVSEELKGLKAKVDGIEQSVKSDVDKRYEAAVNERRKAVVELVSKDESYSTVKTRKAEEAVVQHILDTWETDGIELSVEQAAKEVEEILFERASEWAQVPKLKTSTEPEGAKNLPPLKPGMKTLTNNVAVTGGISRPNKPLHGLPDSERWAEARRRAEERLKKD